MNERHDGLQRIIDGVLEEMAAEEGGGSDPPEVQPGGVLSQDRPHQVEGPNHQEPRLQGASARKRGQEGRGHRPDRAHGPRRRPTPQGRHELAGDIRPAARPGLRGRAHGREGLRRRTPGPRPAQEEAAVAAGEPRAALRDGPGGGVPDGLGVRTVLGLDGTERKIACFAMVCHHCGFFYLPQREAGEPPHRHDPRVRGDGGCPTGC